MFNCCIGDRPAGPPSTASRSRLTDSRLECFHQHQQMFWSSDRLFIPQAWSQSQNSISSLLAEVEELETALKRPGSGPRCEEENQLQVIQTHAVHVVRIFLLKSYDSADRTARHRVRATTPSENQNNTQLRPSASTPIPTECPHQNPPFPYLMPPRVHSPPPLTPPIYPPPVPSAAL